MKITVVNENTNSTDIYQFENEMSVLDLLQEVGVTEVHAPCGGKGACKKCQVYVEGLGNVLSCATKITDGMVVVVKAEKKSSIAVAGSCYIYPTDGEEGLVVGCDIGTTTVVCHLLDAKTGERLATTSEPNAQRSFGADVISRIQSSTEDGVEPQRKAIVRQINKLIAEAKQKAGREERIIRLAVCGNTVMSHLFMNLSPKTIGVSPFTPLSLFGGTYDAAEYGIEDCDELYVAPCVAGYVGGDITADLLACQMHSTELAKSDEKETLVLDIGTNGEMCLGKQGDFVTCATAAGPAFEGGEIEQGMPAKNGAVNKIWIKDGEFKYSTIGDEPAIGICGSGLIDALAVMVESGILDESGLINDEEDVEESFQKYIDEDDDGPCVRFSDSVRITQQDVRKLQLAKAAIGAGIQILISERKEKVNDIEEVILAGGFGSFLDKRSAAIIGLIPKELVDVTRSVGNAAGEGAVSTALSAAARNEISAVKECMRYVELSTHPSFSEKYMEEMFFDVD